MLVEIFIYVCKIEDSSSKDDEVFFRAVLPLFGVLSGKKVCLLNEALGVAVLLLHLRCRRIRP